MTSSTSPWELPGAAPWGLQVPLDFWGHCDDVMITVPGAHNPNSRAFLNGGEKPSWPFLSTRQRGVNHMHGARSAVEIASILRNGNSRHP